MRCGVGRVCSIYAPGMRQVCGLHATYKRTFMFLGTILLYSIVQSALNATRGASCKCRRSSKSQGTRTSKRLQLHTAHLCAVLQNAFPPAEANLMAITSAHMSVVQQEIADRIISEVSRRRASTAAYADATPQSHGTTHECQHRRAHPATTIAKPSS